MLHLLILLRVFPRVITVILEALDTEESRAKFAGSETKVVAPEEFKSHGSSALVFTFAVAVDAFTERGFGFLKI